MNRGKKEHIGDLKGRCVSIAMYAPDLVEANASSENVKSKDSFKTRLDEICLIFVGVKRNFRLVSFDNGVRRGTYRGYGSDLRGLEKGVWGS